MPQAKTVQSNDRAKAILVVDDDAGQRSLLRSFLSRHGFEILVASSAEEALSALESAPIAMMISDVRMPGMSGLEALHHVRRTHPVLPVLLITAYADIRDAVEAMRDGAVDYLEKPIDLDELLASVRKSLGVEPPSAAENPIAPPLDLPPGVVAESPPMRDVLREAAFVAPSESRVLVTGESGVGKEVVADLIHALSPRASGRLVKVNCAAIPETLLESELFGHERGAFTGASAQRVGRFEEARGGTILLDEIAELAPALQAKLLRIAQDGTYQRIGSNKVLHTDARLIASTNRNLESEVREGRFREDLFFRLNVIEIYVPPLRERPADILPLAERFAAEFSGGRPRFSPPVVACLERYAWPGNVRELRNAMERAVLMSRGELIVPEHLPTRVRAAAGAGSDDAPAGAEDAGGAGTPVSGRRMEEIERDAILQSLREHDYNRSETARALAISRRALLYKIQRFREQGYAVEAE
ncbi:sigma-54-dependent Fis family transcriptional regulator [Candidatus Sumerlaeota bacterium]|nr:sigma-54-dependent Fis family transcriptional regulator [Candidatus Sumerlaeota bacterium]